MELTATKRTVTGKGVDALRKAGKIPGVVYGVKEDTTSIELSERDFLAIFKDAGESTVIELTIDGMKKNVLIHDVDHDPISNIIRHVDFYSVQKGQKVEVTVSLEFTGVASVVKEFGANVIKVLYEVDVEAEATNLPHELLVDLSSLTTMESHIAAKDIKLPAGVTLVTDPEEMVVIVSMPEEEVEVPVATPDMASIGISEERGKKEEETPASA